MLLIVKDELLVIVIAAGKREKIKYFISVDHSTLPEDFDRWGERGRILSDEELIAELESGFGKLD